MVEKYVMRDLIILFFKYYCDKLRIMRWVWHVARMTRKMVCFKIRIENDEESLRTTRITCLFWLGPYLLFSYMGQMFLEGQVAFWMVGILFPVAADILFSLHSMGRHSSRLSRVNRCLFPRLYSNRNSPIAGSNDDNRGCAEHFQFACKPSWPGIETVWTVQ